MEVWQKGNCGSRQREARYPDATLGFISILTSGLFLLNEYKIDNLVKSQNS